MWCTWNTMGFIEWTGMFALWGAIAALVVWGIRSSDASRTETRLDALDILEQRLGAGEIDSNEFHRRKRLLGDLRATRR